VIPDQEARDLIKDELQRNIMVDASAGSGKTHSLAGRMAEGLLTGDYEAEGMVAVTFTRKAASELRGRLQQVLEDVLRDDPCEVRQNRARDALTRLDQLFVGTIHSLCSRILREYPVEAGLSPGFQELDDLNRNRILSQVYRRIFQEASERAPESYRALNQGGLRRDTLAPALRMICENQEVKFEAAQVEAPEIEAVWQDVELFAAAMRPRLPAQPDPKLTCPLQKLCFKLERALPHADRSKISVLISLLTDWRKNLKVTQKYWPGEKKKNALAALELAQDFVDETVQPFFTRWQAYLYYHCLVVLKQARQAFQKERVEAARLDFSDLLAEAAKLLRSNLRIRRALGKQFRWLFVDEFQDTDPLQAEVVLFLAAQSESVETEWTKLALRPGSLFVVGDPKQSIYRFRRADIRTYEQVEQCILNSGGLCLQLTASFRSVPQLCGFLNKAFCQLFGSDPSEIQASFSPLQPVRQTAERSLSGVYTLTDHTEKRHYSKVAAREAQRVASLIRGAVKNEGYRWGDFLILTTRRREVLTYAAALEERTIPVESSGGTPDESYWLRVIKALLRALTDPEDTVQTVGVLRDALFGISDRDLFAHRQAGGSFNLEMVSEESAGHPSVRAALLKLQSLYRLSRTLPAGAGIERILEESGTLAMASCADPADGEVPALLHLADQLRDATLEGRSLAQALREIDLTAQERPVSINVGRSDVVRVMNLHQSKGLQAAVVFLVAPTNGMSPRCDIRIARSAGQALGSVAVRAENPYGGRGEVRAAPLDWPQQEARELEALQAEQIRLLYVATTRARDALVVSQWAEQHGRVTLAWEHLLPFLNGAPEIPWQVDEESLESTPVSLNDVNQATLEREARWAACREPSWHRRSVSGQNSEKKLEFKAFEIPEELQGGERLDVGPAWGDLIHRLLEQAVRRPNLTDQELKRLANWFIYDEPDLAPVVPLAVQTVQDVMKTEFWQKVLQGERHLAEVPLGVRAGDGKTLLFGVLDLVTQTGEEWQIVDYKTDVTPMEHLVRQYAGQIETYARHWAESTGEKVSYAGLFRIRSSELSEDQRE